MIVCFSLIKLNPSKISEPVPPPKSLWTGIAIPNWNAYTLMPMNCLAEIFEAIFEVKLPVKLVNLR